MRKPRGEKLQKDLVRMAIDVLEDDIDPIYYRKRCLKRLKIHNQPNGKYFVLFNNIIEYLRELRGDYKNTLKDLLGDYFRCIYQRFMKFNRAPSLLNFSPSQANKVHFEEFIYNFTVEHKEEYWIKEYKPKPEIIYVDTFQEDSAQINFMEV